MIFLCYHELSAAETNPWTLSPASFREHLEVLDSRGYRPVTLDAFDSALFWDERTVVISFDDGREGCIRFAIDALSDFRFNAMFYICTGFIESKNIPKREAYSQFITWADIRDLAKAGHMIGSHSTTHTSFKDLSEQDRVRELGQSKQIIEQRLGRECNQFAAPFGYWDHSSSILAQESGYVTAATTTSGINWSPSLRYSLKRWQVDSPCNRDAFESSLVLLENSHSEFRVFILQTGLPKSINERSLVSELSTYDAVLAPDNETVNKLSQFNIHCLSAEELCLDLSLCETAAQSPEHVLLIDAVKSRFNFPQSSRVRFVT